MSDTPHGTFCHRCEKNVWDSTLLTKNEMRVLLAFERDTPCIRLTFDEGGAIRYKDSSPQTSPRESSHAPLLALPIVAAAVLGAPSDVTASPDERPTIESHARANSTEPLPATNVPSHHMQPEHENLPGPGHTAEQSPPSNSLAGGSHQSSLPNAGSTQGGLVLYGDAQLDLSPFQTFQLYLEGCWGALALATSTIGALLTGIIGGISSTRPLKRLSWLLFLIAVGIFMLRTAVSLSCDFTG